MKRTMILFAAVALCLFGAGVRSDVPFAPAAFQHSLIDPKMVPNGHKPKVIGDFSGTGRGDVAVMTVGQGMKLYRFPTWTPFLISPAAQGGEDAQAADVNRDGALDIVIGGLFNETLWLENPRRSGKDPFATTWAVHTINKGLSSHDVVVGDVNGDGKVDVAVNGGLFLQNTPDSWTVVGRPQIARGAEGTALGDLTGDKSLDLLAPSPDKPYRLCWFENPKHHGGDPVKDVWTRHDIGPGYEQMAIAAADLNGDGRLDVLMAPMYGTGGLVWFEAPRDPRHGAWARHVIDPTIQFVHQGSLQAADFNGDGRPDIAFAEQEQSQTKRVGVFYSLGKSGLTWQRQILTDKGGHNLKVGRIGHDRLPSILSANHGFFGAPNPVELWRNQTAIRR